MNRKAFIKNAVIGGLGVTIVPRHVLGGKGYVSPSDRINLGFIGTGKRGLELLKGMNGCAETLIAAACDVDAKKLDYFISQTQEAGIKKSGTAVTAYRYYRELLERKDIDAIVVAAPDHWHAQISIDAAKAGKDIYCEKPLALSIAEGRAMVNAARKYKRVLQTGSQQRSQQNFRLAAELVWNGYIGTIKEINVSVGNPVKACDLPGEPTPGYLDWDMWVGPSLYRDYSPVLSPPFENKEWARWREFRGFGGGFITDWGAHMFDIVQWALGKDQSGPVLFNPPDNPTAVRGLSFIYSNGAIVNHKNWGEGNAIQFIGTEGNIEVSRSFLRSNPVNILLTAFKKSDTRFYNSNNHAQDWIDAIKTRSKPVADVEIGHRTSTVCNIINIAYELGRPLHWNPEKELFTDKSANLLLSTPYRGKWDFTNY